MSKFINKLINAATRVRGQKKLVEKYVTLNKDIMVLVRDIEELKMNIDNPKIKMKISPGR